LTPVQQLVANLLAQGLLQNQLEPHDLKVLVLVLGSDRETVLGCELRPFSEIAPILGVETMGEAFPPQPLAGESSQDFALTSSSNP